ncbi:hypothetical protein KSP35_23205 [Aquihabitans sp. G128]|uniref:hypothetical protein n=1 Tax=Aquihabitans sp. G128 TaxID=2849779 RepID=UPI001C2425A9|nr:hypothetical protein [Aquihabitans sp. G128]QXC61182.1 hypothetical protein KSP35_23205 [Aquihabitans sp. G128]
MHPIERLRYVARATGAPPDDVFREACAALAGFSDDPGSLVTACRRLIDRHAANGPIWWLCARTLVAADPGDEAWRCLDDLVSDPTLDELVHALPDDARITVVGWPERVAAALARRGDVEVRVVDVEGDGPGFVRLLERSDVHAVDVAVTGLAGAAAASDLVVLETLAVGPDVALVAPGSWAAAAVARAAGVPVWAVAGAGRLVPSGMWPSLTGRLAGAATAPWGLDHDLLPLDLVDQLVGPAGPEAVAAGLRRLDTPDAAELRR